MPRISRYDLDRAEARRQQAEDDLVIAAWEAGVALAKAEQDEDDGSRAYEREFDDTESRYWSGVQDGFEADRIGRPYDRYAHVQANYGSGQGDQDDDWYYDDDGACDRPYDDPDGEEEPGTEHDYAEYYKYIDRPAAFAESYRAWLDKTQMQALTEVEEAEADAIDAWKHSHLALAAKAVGLRLTPDADPRKLRAPRRRKSKAWKDVARAHKRWAA